MKGALDYCNFSFYLCNKRKCKLKCNILRTEIINMMSINNFRKAVVLANDKIMIKTILSAWQVKVKHLLKMFGGEGGYERFLEVMADKEHSEHERLKQWSNSQGYREFDINYINRRLKSRGLNRALFL